MNETPLSNLEVNPGDIEILRSYAILTVEQLLGATFGFTKVDVFTLLKDPEKLVAAVKEKVTGEELARYEEVMHKYPTGCLKSE